MRRAHHETQRALAGQDPVHKIRDVLGWDGYDHPWNLVKYTLGSHDDIGDLQEGDAEDGLINWDRRHRYLVDQLGGRDDWTARAKCRLAWALNVAMPGTPMLFMGSECLQAAPQVGWGYWHDGHDRHGDHRFDWTIAGDPLGMQMRRLVGAANAVRWANPALRADSLDITHEDHDNQVLAFAREAGDERRPGGRQPRRPDVPRPRVRSADRRARRPVDPGAVHPGRGLRRVGRRGQCVPRALDPGRRDGVRQPAEVEHGRPAPDLTKSASARG